MHQTIHGCRRYDRIPRIGFLSGLRSSFSVAYIFHYVRSLFGSNSVLVDGSGGSGVTCCAPSVTLMCFLAVSVKPYVSHTMKLRICQGSEHARRA